MVEGVADDVDKVAATTACLFFGFLDGATTISESYGGGGGNYGDGTEAIGGRRAGGGPGSLCSTEVTVFVPPSTSVAVACAASRTAGARPHL